MTDAMVRPDLQAAAAKGPVQQPIAGWGGPCVLDRWIKATSLHKTIVGFEAPQFEAQSPRMFCVRWHAASTRTGCVLPMHLASCNRSHASPPVHREAILNEQVGTLVGSRCDFADLQHASLDIPALSQKRQMTEATDHPRRADRRWAIAQLKKDISAGRNRDIEVPSAEKAGPAATELAPGGKDQETESRRTSMLELESARRNYQSSRLGKPGPGLHPSLRKRAPPGVRCTVRA
ncbi:uncharacterized protein THITE_2125155 [Thermothielavioides terrestris NRRL 8126]|uniref:Uncharacterized protein n=1 Tax=Thermothielavioides terrestris (strain ATCC 38088 / NRRL 8126) TaxID=578455 RepID=G2QRF2_THETT|nr:uncharacterized protein THITE_2125155 [Thermothielavioides terrestris NRRL 8126]AEO62497.1 hypothetical protein THITE_2125155 [Thermothielavioides terrestris NRRL 8126]